jgi:phosphoribosylanthranilate isomerase
MTMTTVGVKICGLTNPDQARAVAAMRPDAIGLVFYPPSPRYVSDELAAELIEAIGLEIPTVGVFVDEPAAEILRRVDELGLACVQLHGRESNGDVGTLLDAGLHVINVRKETGPALLNAASKSPATRFLVEAQRGELPGGNGQVWEWSKAASLGIEYPFVLAGGLSPDNVAEAIDQAHPDAVDVSSGIEASPGTKDLAKVEQFITAVRAITPTWPVRNVFA